MITSWYGQGRQTLPRLRIVAFGLIAALVCSASAAPATAAPAPASINLAQYRGKVVYVDFWASWCAPCKLSFPFMDQLRLTYPTKDLVIITIDVDHDRKAATAFLTQAGTTLPVIYDPDGKIASSFDVATMPTSFLFDRSGHQRFVHRGFFESKAGEYYQHVRALVDEK